MFTTDDNWFKKTIVFLSLYYVIYGIISQFIEPFSWFGENSLLESVGPWANIVLLLLPAIILAIYYFTNIQKDQALEKNYGLLSVSTGANRIDAFQKISKKAKRKLVIVGVGMTNLSRYARDRLSEIGKHTPIEFLMIDPELLESNQEFADMLDRFRDITDYRQSVRHSFDLLKAFCEEWNNEPNNHHKMSLKVYSTIPFMSMILIDPEEPAGEAVVEFIPYKAGEYRPRLHIKKIIAKDSLFDQFEKYYIKFWVSAKRIV